MFNEIKNVESYSIPKTDVIYRNKNAGEIIPNDLVLYEKYLDPFLKGKRKINRIDLLNISDGYRIFQESITRSIRTDHGNTETLINIGKRIKENFLKIWDISLQFDQPSDPYVMELTEAEKEEWKKGVAEEDRYGNPLPVKFQKLATKLSKKYTFVFRPDFNEFLYYNSKEGTYSYGAAEFISKNVREILGERSTTHIVNEIVAYIRDLSLRTEPDFSTPPYLINLVNGVLDWKNLKLLPHSPDYNFRTVLPFEYNVHARDSRFFKVLEEITKDDMDKALKVMETYAWAFIPGYPIQKAVAFFGTGNNGKSVLLNFLYALLGRENTSSTPLQTLCNNRFSVPGLRGKLMNIAGDVGDAALYDTSMFKNLTGADEVEGEIKGLQRRPKFVNEAKMVFGFNRLPSTWDQSRAYFRRFELIEFIQDFTGREEHDLLQKITKKRDLQAVFNLIVEVFLPILSDKLTFHRQDSIEETTQRYKLNSNPALAFIDEMLEPSPDKEIEGKDLYNRFFEWCKEKGITAVSPQSFGNTLLKHSEMAVYHKNKQKDGTRKYYYIGIAIKDIEPEEDKNAYTLGSDKKSICTFWEAVNSYVETYSSKTTTYTSYTFYTPRTCNSEYSKRVENVYEVYAVKKYNTTKTPLVSREIDPAYTYVPETQSICSKETGSHNSDINSGVSEQKVHVPSSLELNQSQKIQKTIMEIANKISQGKPEIKIKPSTILENLPTKSKDLRVSPEDLNERILPSMAADGLITLHNGTISVTGKKVEEINYVLVSVLEDLPGIAWKDNNYYLHKGDIAHVPEEIADLLIQRQWATRITETNGRDEPVDKEGLSITEEEGMKIRDALLSLGIHLKAAETGKSYDGKKFQISFETGYFNQNRDKIESKMKELGFTQSNTGSLGIVFFNRPLKKGDQP